MNANSPEVPLPPAVVSDVVQAASARIVGELDLPLLVNQLQAVGSNLNEAFRGTAQFPDLQVKVQHAAFLLARLGDKSAAELEAFRHAAGTVLEDLECVYSLVRDGMEDVALATLRSTNEGSAKLASDARSLSIEFMSAADGVESLLQHMLKRRWDQEERRKALAADVAELHVLLEQARNSKSASDQGFEEAHALYEEAQRKEAIARMKCNTMQMAQVATTVSGMVSARPALHVVGLGGVTALASAFEAEAIRAREEKAVYLHERHKQRMSRLDLGKDVAGITARLRGARAEDQVAQTTVDSLENALSGLRILSGVMMKSGTFWEQIDSTVNRADCLALESAIESSKALASPGKQELWTSQSVTKRAVAVYSPWVALENVCGNYLEKMRSTRSNLYEFLEVAPDPGQSLQFRGSIEN